MNRPIKYRAWHKTENKMCSAEEINFKNLVAFLPELSPEIHPKYNIPITNSGRLCSFDEIILMQFTGIKDKNGNEIFEGDTVKIMVDKYDLDKEEGEEYYQVEEISFIEYTNHGFWVNKESFGWEGEDLWDWDKIEVVGNIYENPST